MLPSFSLFLFFPIFNASREWSRQNIISEGDHGWKALYIRSAECRRYLELERSRRGWSRQNIKSLETITSENVRRVRHGGVLLIQPGARPWAGEAATDWVTGTGRLEPKEGRRSCWTLKTSGREDGDGWVRGCRCAGRSEQHRQLSP